MIFANTKDWDEIYINSNFENYRYFLSLGHIVNIWAKYNNYRYGTDFLVMWNQTNTHFYIKNFLCNPRITKDVRSVWSDDDNLYILNPKFKHYVNLLISRDHHIPQITDWLRQNNNMQYNIYYTLDLPGEIHANISFDDISDMTMFKLRFL